MKPKQPFAEVLQLIKSAEVKAYSAVNTVLIELYWNIGRYISERQEWGKGTVDDLAVFLQREVPGRSGFSARNLWRMKQFFEAYEPYPELSPLVTEISWTHHQIILVQCKTTAERAFYIRLTQSERLSKRELERQIRAATFERTVLADAKRPPAANALAGVENVFRDGYVFEFLSLPEVHSEKDLQTALLRNLKAFILELGRDFAFMGDA